LVLGLHVFDALEALVRALELLFAAADFVVKLCFVLSKLFQSFLHFIHLTGLSIDNVSDAFFDISLLGIRIKITANSIEEVKSFIAG